MRFLKRLFRPQYRVDKGDDGLLYISKKVFIFPWMPMDVVLNMSQAMRVIDKHKFPEQRVTVHEE